MRLFVISVDLIVTRLKLRPLRDGPRHNWNYRKYGHIYFSPLAPENNQLYDPLNSGIQKSADTTRTTSNL